MARGRRRVEDPAMARRILAAAERHFAAQGMEGARTEEIAMAARANKAMLYYYFGNKRRLHRAVLENLLRQLRSGVLAPPAKKLSAKQKLFRYVSGYFDFLATHPNYPRLVQREAMESRPNFDWMAREYFRPLIQGLSRVVEEGVTNRQFRDIDPEQTALITIGMTTSYFATATILSQVVGRNLLTDSAVAARKRAVLDFLDHAVVRQGPRSR